MKVEKAKKVLKQSGHYVDNLWHIDDIMLRYACDDPEQAQEILNAALTNEATMNQIWFAIDMVAQDEGLKLIED
jgi:hypothetical protein